MIDEAERVGGAVWDARAKYKCMELQRGRPQTQMGHLSPLRLPGFHVLRLIVVGCSKLEVRSFFLRLSSVYSHSALSLSAQGR